MPPGEEAIGLRGALNPSRGQDRLLDRRVAARLAPAVFRVRLNPTFAQHRKWSWDSRSSKTARFKSGPFGLLADCDYAQPWPFTKLVMTGMLTYSPW